MSENQISKPFYESKIFQVNILNFVISALLIIGEGDYSNWRLIISAVVVPVITLILRIFYSTEKLTLK